MCRASTDQAKLPNRHSCNNLMQWLSFQRPVRLHLHTAVPHQWTERHQQTLETLQQQIPDMFNGPALHLLSVEHGYDADIMHVAPSTYFVVTTERHLPVHAKQVINLTLQVHVVSSDQQIALVQRSANVYAPNHWMVAAGETLEPTDATFADPLAVVYRTLREELALQPSDIANIATYGIAQSTIDNAAVWLAQAASTLSAAQIERQRQQAEGANEIAVCEWHSLKQLSLQELQASHQPWLEASWWMLQSLYPQA